MSGALEAMTSSVWGDQDCKHGVKQFKGTMWWGPIRETNTLAAVSLLLCHRNLGQIDGDKNREAAMEVTHTFFPFPKLKRECRDTCKNVRGNQRHFHKSNVLLIHYTVTSTMYFSKTKRHQPDRRLDRMCNPVQTSKGVSSFEKSCGTSHFRYQSTMAMVFEVEAFS